MVAAESLSMQVPIVARNGTGAVEIVEHNSTGYVATSEDAYVGYAQKLLSDECSARVF